MRIAAQETALQIALRNCSKEARGKGQCRCDFGEGKLHAIKNTFFVECFRWSCERFCWSITQLYLTLCDPMNCSLPGSSVHGIFQARMLEYFVISSSRGCSQSKNRTHVSCVSCMAGRFFTTEPPGNPQLFLIECI